MNTCYYVLVHLLYIVYGTSVIIIYPISKLNTCTTESVEFVLTHIHKIRIQIFPYIKAINDLKKYQ